MRLQDYLTKTGMTQTAFADLLGVKQATISRYLSGARKPEPDLMVRIFEATRGSVSPNDFFDVPSRRRAMRQAAQFSSAEA